MEIPRALALLLTTVALAGCGKDRELKTTPEGRTVHGSAWNNKTLSFRVYRLSGFRGLSGLTVDETGALWAAAERERRLVRLSSGSIIGASGELRVRVFPTEIFMPGRDVEALTFLGKTSAGKTFLLGTEHRYFSSSTDELMQVRLRAGRLRKDGRFTLAYKIWQTRAQKNRGIEGLCAWEAASRRGVLAAVETVPETGGRRLGLMALGVRASPSAPFRWTPLLFPLTSPVGKIAGLHCRTVNSGIEAVAIERHYGVRRIIAFRIPRLDAPAFHDVRVLLDLEKILNEPEFTARERRRFNPEGIARLPDGTMAVIGDNSAADTATLLLLIRLSPSQNTGRH